MPSIAWELYLNAGKWGKAEADERRILQTRLRAVREELEALKRGVVILWHCRWCKELMPEHKAFWHLQKCEERKDQLVP